jgi:protein-L-isoaspartate O-methyltransferase
MTYTATATYSPDDNKLRLYAGGRLPPETYARVKAAGFAWAPKQELFVAPMWTPHREDLLLELCGEIGDEDTSLTERAEERAERFEQYQENRAADAESARKAVAAIADNIPLGQPILVGHHSERHARRDAEKIANGMRRAVRMWETSRYWQERAKGAIRHAKYKERPDVRARRIKGIEADKRKQEKIIAESQALLKAWRDPAAVLKRKDGEPATLRQLVVFLANRDGGYYAAEYTHPSGYVGPISLWEAAGGNINEQDPEAAAIATPEQVQAKAIQNHEGRIAWAQRWLAHYENRLTYERAMLADAGGTAADRNGPEKGGAVRCWCSPGHGKGWSYVQKVNRVSVTLLDDWGNGGPTFTRTIPFDKLAAIMTAAQVREAREAGRIADLPNGTGFYLREPGDTTKPQTRDEAGDRVHREAVQGADTAKATAASFEAMRDTLRQGVQVVTAPQLFPTPPELAARMVALADIQPGHDVLEPSAGTARIIRAIREGQPQASITAVELKAHLAEILRSAYRVPTHCRDFLQCNGELGTFDRVLMNPPFQNAEDIKHIRHAMQMLKPGGRLVAICANGPRQREQLMPIAAEWIDLPPGTFSDSGTEVNAAMLVIKN